MPDNHPRYELFQRVRRHLPPIGSFDLLILKGHLLIEEQLDALIAAFSRDARPLKTARLTFFQKLCVAEALCGSLPVSKFIRQLNTLRNDLAHNLDTENIEARVDELLRIDREEEFQRRASTRQRASHLRGALVYTIALLIGFVDGHVATQTGARHGRRMSDSDTNS